MSVPIPITRTEKALVRQRLFQVRALVDPPPPKATAGHGAVGTKMR